MLLRMSGADGPSCNNHRARRRCCDRVGWSQLGLTKVPGSPHLILRRMRIERLTSIASVALLSAQCVCPKHPETHHEAGVEGRQCMS